MIRIKELSVFKMYFSNTKIKQLSNTLHLPLIKVKRWHFVERLEVENHQFLIFYQKCI